MTALLVIGILVLLIVAHELGHFLVAKLFGLRVDEFGIGYPPRALFLGRWGGTEYTLNWIPFGGFVRIRGDDGTENASDLHRFTNASKKVQAAVLIAGVAMNALMGWVLITGALSLGVPRAAGKSEAADARLIVSNVLARSPAEAAGLRAGDTVLSLESGGARIPHGATPDDITEFVRSRGGRNITVFYERGVERGEVIVRPAHAVVSNDPGRVAIGVELALVTDEPLPFSEALKTGFAATLGMFRSVGDGLWSVVAGAFRGEPAWRGLVGPIGIVGVVSQATAHGAGYVLALAAFISVNLAVINLIPVPALDGGRIAILAYEGLRGRRVSRLAMGMCNVIGVGLLGLLIILVTYQDIARLLG